MSDGRRCGQVTALRLRIKKGDRVLVRSGKDKNKKGKVIAAYPGEGKVKVEGVNIIKKHAKPTQKVKQGGIREMEAPIYASKVVLICPECSQPTRVSKAKTVKGEPVRSCKKCGEAIDK